MNALQIMLSTSLLLFIVLIVLLFFSPNKNVDMKKLSSKEDIKKIKDQIVTSE